MDFFLAHPPTFFIAIGVLSLMVGSFLNVVIYRLPRMLHASACDFNLAKPRSFCPHCEKALLWWHYFPVLSYTLLLGKCHFCGARISLRYPLVESLSVVMALLVALKFGISLTTLVALPLGYTLLALLFIDLETYLLPDQLTLLMLWVGLLASVGGTLTDPASAIIGAVAGYSSFWLIAKGFKKLRGVEGLGQGDMKCLAMLGAWLGWQALPIIVFTAAGSGCIIGALWLTLTRRGYRTPIPFGPFLVIGGFVALLLPDRLLYGLFPLIG